MGRYPAGYPAFPSEFQQEAKSTSEISPLIARAPIGVDYNELTVLVTTQLIDCIPGMSYTTGRSSVRLSSYPSGCKVSTRGGAEASFEACKGSKPYLRRKE